MQLPGFRTQPRGIGQFPQTKSVEPINHPLIERPIDFQQASPRQSVIAAPRDRRQQHGQRDKPSQKEIQVCHATLGPCNLPIKGIEARLTGEQGGL